MRPAWELSRALTWLLILQHLPVGLEGVWQRGVCGRASGQTQVSGPGGGGSIPGPAGRLAIEHPQLVIHGVRADLVMAALLLRRGDVTQNSIDRGDLKVQCWFMLLKYLFCCVGSKYFFVLSD